MTWNTNDNEHIVEYEENDSTSFRSTNNSNSTQRNSNNNSNSEQGLQGYDYYDREPDSWETTENDNQDYLDIDSDTANSEYIPIESTINGAKPNSKQLQNLRLVYDNVIYPRLQDIADWRGDGYSLEMIARKLGLSVYQFTLARNTFYELYAVLMESTNLVVAKIEKAAMDRAIGYYKPEVTRKFAISGGRKIPVEETHKYSWVQDGNSQKFLLQNLKPEKYGNKQVNNTTNNTLVVNADTITNKEILNRVNKIVGRNNFQADIIETGE